jgi:hypothetical protein
VIGASPELPDLKVDGNALSATSMNQTTIMNSRTCLYSHPDDEDVITSMHLPGPREWEIDPTATAGFIKEEGLYGGSPSPASGSDLCQWPLGSAHGRPVDVPAVGQ